MKDTTSQRRFRRPLNKTTKQPTDRKREGDLKHILDTGIDMDEAKDPGSQTPRVPADDRS